MADDVTDPDATTDGAVGPDPVADDDADPAAADDAAEAPSEGDDDADEAADAVDAVDAGATKGAKAAKGTKASKAGAKVEPAEPVVRKKVVSKRVTPKGAEQGAKASTAPRSKGGAPEGGYSARYTPPAATYAKGPSPWWVPAIMFALLIVGALVIMLNYMGVFGDAANIRLVIGLGLILGGIITATQYR
jgi:hypothetical protein